MSCAIKEKKTIATVTASIAVVLKLAAIVMSAKPAAKDRNGITSSAGEYPLVVFLVYIFPPEGLAQSWLPGH
ncbi:hypothetical protein CXX84_09420 [Arthrobacter sp. AFG7.2]|nr:hypothetical protein CXX84_09420 [Arthrobacter sp. AFG7.2]